jgi:hypothetical protein
VPVVFVPSFHLFPTTTSVTYAINNTITTINNIPICFHNHPHLRHDSGTFNIHSTPANTTATRTTSTHCPPPLFPTRPRHKHNTPQRVVEGKLPFWLLPASLKREQEMRSSGGLPVAAAASSRPTVQETASTVPGGAAAAAAAAAPARNAPAASEVVAPGAGVDGGAGATSLSSTVLGEDVRQTDVDPAVKVRPIDVDSIVDLDDFLAELDAEFGDAAKADLAAEDLARREGKHSAGQVVGGGAASAMTDGTPFVDLGTDVTAAAAAAAGGDGGGRRRRGGGGAPGGVDEWVLVERLEVPF